MFHLTSLYSVLFWFFSRKQSMSATLHLSKRKATLLLLPWILPHGRWTLLRGYSTNAENISLTSHRGGNFVQSVKWLAIVRGNFLSEEFGFSWEEFLDKQSAGLPFFPSNQHLQICRGDSTLNPHSSLQHTVMLKKKYIEMQEILFVLFLSTQLYQRDHHNYPRIFQYILPTVSSVMRLISYCV